MKGLRKKLCVCGMGLTLFLTGCGSSGGNFMAQAVADNNYNGSAAYGAEMYDGNGIYEMASTESNSSGSSAQNVREGRKLIRTVRMEVETLEFDELLAYVQNKTAELGGYVESMNVYNGSGYTTYYYGSGYRQERNASLTLRIPKDNMDLFLTDVDTRGNITSRSEQEIDVTLDYVDLDSHKQVLLAEQERLLSMMEQAETIEDLIILESRLSDIRYQIESMESRLRTYDNQIEYSTVYLTLDEVVELTPIAVEEKSAWQRMGEGFMKSLKNIGNGIKEFGINFVIALPYLIILFIFAGLLIWFIIFMAKKNKIKRQKLLAEQMELMQSLQAEQEKQMGKGQ